MGATMESVKALLKNEYDERINNQMPLHEGSSQKTISSNIKEIMDAYKKKKKIGTSHPKSKKEAIKQAAAIAYRKSRE